MTSSVGPQDMPHVPPEDVVALSQWTRPRSRGLRWLWYVVLIAPSVAALAWTVFPAAQTLTAVARFNPSPLATPNDDQWQDSQRTLELRRYVQRHFRDHGIYIPLEDIVAPESTPAGPDDLSLLMQKACGQGKLYVWIPLKLNLPVAGEKVFEWCWKPQIKAP